MNKFKNIVFVKDEEQNNIKVNEELLMYGWAGKILKVNLNEGKITTLDTEPYSERFIGGLGIGEKLYWDEAKVEQDAFHPDNPLIFMTGPLAATPAPAAPRWIACGKSPLMNPEMFYSGSLSGFWGAELKMAGYDGIIIKGRADHPVYINIADEKVEIKDARHLWGRKNSETQRTIRNEAGEKVKLMTIGPGAENNSRIGIIATDVAGSGSRGFGSVMGAKNLKAIAVAGSGKIPVFRCRENTEHTKQSKRDDGRGLFQSVWKSHYAPGLNRG